MAFEADYRLSPGATLKVWPELSVSPDAFSGPCQILCLYFAITKETHVLAGVQMQLPFAKRFRHGLQDWLCQVP